MKLLKRYSSNSKLAKDGKEFVLSEKGFITLRRTDSKVVTEFRAELEAPYQTLVANGGKIPENKLREILVQTAAHAIVVDIRGQDWFEDGDPRIGDEKENPQGIVKWVGDSIDGVKSQSEEDARIAWLTEVLMNPDQEPLLDKIYALAGSYESFRDTEIKAIRGN